MRYGILMLCVAATLFVSAAARSDEITPDKLVKTQLEVDALSALNDLNLTPGQLKSLGEMSEGAVGVVPAPAGEINGSYVAALSALHDAILTRDDDRIDAAEQRVSDLEDQLDIDTPTVALTDAACAKAGDALKLLTPHQVAEYIAQNVDDFPDAEALLGEAMDQCRDLPKDQFVDLRQEVADEISVLAAFKAPNASKPSIHQKIVSFLNRVHGLSDEEFKNQRSALDDEAKNLVKDIGPIRAIQNWMERELAELLANPELHDAMDEYQKTVPGNS